MHPIEIEADQTFLLPTVDGVYHLGTMKPQENHFQLPTWDPMPEESGQIKRIYNARLDKINKLAISQSFRE